MRDVWTSGPSLHDQFGEIDIYLFDQLLRGRIVHGHRILDAGCGGGRNLVYFLRHGFDVWATDQEPAAVDAVRVLMERLAPGIAATRLRHEPVEALTYPDRQFDVVISSAVLHFARSDAHFEAMVGQMWRVLKPGGLYFARLASTIGFEGRVAPIGDNRYLLPDGSERYLVTAERLLSLTTAIGGQLLDPLKTTVVHEQRAMTTWVARKAEA